MRLGGGRLRPVIEVDTPRMPGLISFGPQITHRMRFPEKPIRSVDKARQLAQRTPDTDTIAGAGHQSRQKRGMAVSAIFKIKGLRSTEVCTWTDKVPERS